jgi:hypothetical protein
MKTEIKEKPISFSAPMIQALLEGRKSQTRRIIKPQREVKWFPDSENFNVKNAGWFAHIEENDTSHDQEWRSIQCPYGGIGSRLYVKENIEAVGHNVMGQNLVRYAADERTLVAADSEQCEMVWLSPRRKRNSRYMPRWASRILLEITDIRVQRVNEISAEDCIAEGCEDRCHGEYDFDYDIRYTTHAQSNFRRLWDSIHGEGAWLRNDWVWVLEFKRIEP